MLIFYFLLTLADAQPAAGALSAVFADDATLSRHMPLPTSVRRLCNH